MKSSLRVLAAFGVAAALIGGGCMPTPPAPIPQEQASGATPPPAPSAVVIVTKKGSSDSLKVLSPAADGKVGQPLRFTGEARTWYFEGSFPVHVLNKDGKLIASGIATAQSDWMTSDWVPFTGEIDYPPQTTGSTGTVVFIKDNPSGDPSHDDYGMVEIKF